MDWLANNWMLLALAVCVVILLALFGRRSAADERDTCVFCHGSHNAGEGLPNRPETRQPARVRETETMGSRPEQLSAGSRACRRGPPTIRR